MSAAKNELTTKLNLISARFKSTDLERSYRQYYFHHDKAQAAIIIALGTIPLTVFGYSDYQFFGVSTQLYKLIIVRGLVLLSSLITVIVLLRLTANGDRTIDRVIFLWVIILSNFTFYINSTRPPDYFFNLVIDITLLLSIYVFFHNNLISKAILALYLTLGNIVIILLFKNLSPIAERAIWLSYLFANLSGLWISWRLHIDRRTQFNLLMKERRLADELKEALENIKTLKGLLPICSSCKKIRDDEGYWHQVEVYIHEHTDVNFSHGICPDCVQRLYPRTAAKKKT
jgi:hypothetical protein